MLDLLTYAAARSYTDNQISNLEFDSNIYKYQGSVNTFEDLPTDAKIGYVYNVIEENGQNYCWTGEEWDALGQNFIIEDGSISLKKLEGSDLETFVQVGPNGASAPLIVNKDTNEIQETNSRTLQDIVFKNIVEPCGSTEGLGILALEWDSQPRNLSINTLKEYVNSDLTNYYIKEEVDKAIEAVSIQSVMINDAQELVITLTNNTTYNCGVVVGKDGASVISATVETT